MALLFSVFVVVNLWFLGFPDGHLTEFDRDTAPFRGGGAAGSLGLALALGYGGVTGRVTARGLAWQWLLGGMLVGMEFVGWGWIFSGLDQGQGG